MSDEIRVRCGIQVLKGNFQYRPVPETFLADMSTARGPTPGGVTISTAGTNISLAELIVPGFCRMANLDDTNYLEYGIWDADTAVFYPFGELLPGEITVIRLSRRIGTQLVGTGTGVGDTNNFLRLKANTAPIEALVEALEK